MTRKGIAFDRYEAQARERDLSPLQCCAARKLLGLHLDDLADMAGLHADEVGDFENGDERGGGLNICDRFKIASALWAVGVTFDRGAASEGIRVHRRQAGGELWSDGPSPPQLRAALVLLGWNTPALADIAGIALARAEAIISGEAVSEPEPALLIKAFRAAGVRFYGSGRGVGVSVRCRRPWYRAWLESRAQRQAAGSESK
jgi:transcriptional regulator with XRE-family HTH domain